jgi:hypothetical protein
MTDSPSQPAIPLATVIPGQPPPTPAEAALARAARGAYLLGALSAFFGILLAVLFGLFNRLPQFRLSFEIFGIAVFLVPGILLFWSRNLSRRPSRAGLALAVITCLYQFALACVLLACQMALRPISIVPVLGNAIWLAALTLLALDLLRASPALRAAELTRRPGFPVLPKPAGNLPASEKSAPADRTG